MSSNRPRNWQSCIYMENRAEIVFVSRVFSHHQKPVSDALYKITGGRYAFVETVGLTKELQTLGYQGLGSPYLARADKDLDEMSVMLIREAETVVFGGLVEEMIRPRLLENKLVFRCYERPLKNGSEPLKYIPRWIKWHHQNPRGKRVYMLCASAYTAGDYVKYGLFRGRCFKWGYFPPFRNYEDIEGLLGQKDPQKILWVGRFLDWKHPDDALRAVKLLKDRGVSFRMDIIGTGKLEPELRQLWSSLALQDHVRFLGSMPPEEVRKHMENAGILLVCSDRREGWGATVNEAMNSACAVVCGHEVGAAPFLVKHKENGIIYRSCDVVALADRIEELLTDPCGQAALGAAAYRTIQEEWNADIAAERLVKLSKDLQSGGDGMNLFQSGPCSPAVPIRDDWFPG